MATVVTGDCLRQPDFLAPSDRIEHLPFLFWLVPALAPLVCVDLGAGSGTGYFALCQAVAAAGLPARCLACDLWDGAEGAGSFRTVSDHNARHYAGFSQIRQADPGAGPAPAFPGPVGLLVIGGDSAEAGFAAWSGVLAPGAVVLIHGTDAGAAARLWQRLSADHPAFGFRHGGGLGVVAMGETPPGLAGLFDTGADPDAGEALRATFAALGRGLAAGLERDDLRAAVEALTVGADAAQAPHGDPAELAALRRDLARARGRPLRTLGDYLAFRLLGGLARFSPPLSGKRAARLVRSAAKRDPARSLGADDAPGDRDAAGDSGATARLAPATAGRTADPARPTVLVVSHEASLTGAPVLAWNLVRTLAETCNVVTLTLKGGPLCGPFRAASVAFYETDRKTIGAGALRRMVRGICARHGIAYALVNSVQSRAVLPGLRAAGVPSVALIHEFAANIRPAGAMAEVIRDADRVVFSTRMTLENALASCGLSRGAAIHVLPQGKCLVPAAGDGGDAAAERHRLDGLLRPGGAGAEAEAGVDAGPRDYVVIGAGAIEPRKGVDLFIECATRLCAAPGGGRFRFVWIGAGYDPETDNRGSALLADQIARAGIGGQLAVIPPTGEIEYAYRQADLLLLTSRLDPLPNVAIDALVAGTPVVCFARTTGIADVLAESGLAAACVARYLDTADMAAKVRALADDTAFRAGVARQGQQAAAARFDFPRYAARLQALAGSVQPRAQQIEADVAAIAASGAFRPDFFRPRPRARDSADAAIAEYVRASWEGAALRKPMPGFNPAVYAERTDPAEKGGSGEPFVRFLAAGQPAGPWACPLITPDSPNALPADPPRVALQIHAFYLDEVGAILDRLMRNRARPDLFVSTLAGQVDAARAAFAAYDGPVAAIEPVPNRGRDIAPWLTHFGPRLTDGYDIIGHVHTKKTLDYGARRTIDAWKDFLAENLLGGDRGGAMLDRVLAAMTADPQIAIVFPDDPNVMGWGPNRAIAETLAARMGIDLLPDQFDFSVGSMAWMRAGLFRQFVALGLDWGDYPTEPVPHDGTVLHALERLFGVVPAIRGQAVALTNVPGLSR